MEQQVSRAVASQSANWSRPHYGVSHLGNLGDNRWATVIDRGSFAELIKWFRGCGMQPYECAFDTAGQARSAGEAWVEKAAA